MKKGLISVNWGMDVGVTRKICSGLSIAALMCCGVVPQAFSQGFLEMPDTSEVPEYKRDALLLDLDIPPVRDRDPDPEAGPRLQVKEFRVQGILEFPERGITREEIIKRVEAIRFDLMKEGLKTDTGFTLDELGEIANLVLDIERSTLTEHVGPLEVQKFVFLVRDQMRRRGVTVGMIETVADTITRFYRERGFILAKAYIPVQEVRDGVVTLTLLLGELGEVQIEDTRRVSHAVINNVFKGDMDQPVANQNMDTALTLINDIPGLSARGYFSPGTQLGDTRMTIKVTDEEWTSMNFRLDNHGSESTSENRAYADIYIHNPLGIGDEIYIAALNSYNPNGSTYGSLRYSSFLLSPRWRASVGASTNDFVSRDLRESAQFFSGESTVTDLSMKRIFTRRRARNTSIELKYTDIQSTLDTIASSTEENAEKTSLSFQFDILNERRRHLYLGSLGLHHADTFEEGGFSGTVEGEDSFFTYDVSMLTFFNFPFTQKETRAVIKSAGQYAGKAISNLNQINLAGPLRTRAFGVNGLQSDDGVYFGVDWIFSLPKIGSFSIFGEELHRIFQPYVFVDASYGVIQPVADTDEEITGQLANTGVGLKFTHSNFQGNISYGSVLADDVNELQDSTPTTSVYFGLQMSF